MTAETPEKEKKKKKKEKTGISDKENNWDTWKDEALWDKKSVKIKN